MKKFNLYFSDFFNVSAKTVEDYGAFNISLIYDLPLFVDPFLLFNSKNETYTRLHEEIIKYMMFLKDKSSSALPRGSIKAWYFFPEVKQNWLGYSKTGNAGRGLGPDFANSLKVNLTTIFSDFGDEQSTSTHLEKLTLVKDGVGKDQISDFTCNLIRGFLADYTQSFALQYIDAKMRKKVMVEKVEFDYGTQTWRSDEFILPVANGDFVLLTPCNILTKDESWISHRGFTEDFLHVVDAVDNDQLRASISNYLAAVLPTEPTKKELRAGFEKTAHKFPGLLDVYIKLQETDADEATDSSMEKILAAQRLFVEQLSNFVHLVDKQTKFYSTKTSSFAEGLARVNFLKQVIEQGDGYRLFYIKGLPVSRESDLQIMFKLTWFASAYSADAEVNNGRGPADFLVSYGSADKTIIEFKLASNTSLEINLQHQAEIYANASRATHPPIKAILYFNQRELSKVKSILSRLGLEKKESIVLISAEKRPSASKADGSEASDKPGDASNDDDLNDSDDESDLLAK